MLPNPARHGIQLLVRPAVQQCGDRLKTAAHEDLAGAGQVDVFGRALLDVFLRFFRAQSVGRECLVGKQWLDPVFVILNVSITRSTIQQSYSLAARLGTGHHLGTRRVWLHHRVQHRAVAGTITRPIHARNPRYDCGVTYTGVHYYARVVCSGRCWVLALLVRLLVRLQTRGLRCAIPVE